MLGVTPELLGREHVLPRWHATAEAAPLTPAHTAAWPALPSDGAP